ncbi:MAG: hypothetical protein M1817_005566 [Caeruleum heppii]|nr:MAG: hypothetical protein M1817_005566 [Caeruleum heppii]
MFCLLRAVLLALAWVDLNQAETIHGSVAFTRHGDRTPLVLEEPSARTSLTPLGARQLSSAGSFFRNRYLMPEGSSNASSANGFEIRGLSKNVIDNSQLYAIAAGEAYVSNSAHAFFQGLYPPTTSDTGGNNSVSLLANGSNVEAPLGGYQYPQIFTVSARDPSSIWIAGDANCPQYSISRARYYDTDAFVETHRATRPLYTGLDRGILDGVVPNVAVGYYNAYNIYDYVNYGYVHNITIRNNISETDFQQLRILADRHEYAINGNLTASGFQRGDMIRAIAGRTLATHVVALLTDNVQSRGTSEKLNLMFGSHEPFLAFFALTQLPQLNPNFYGLPDYGSSMVFELYSSGNTTSYPDSADLMVRFLFRNGTAANEDLQSYPLFGRGPSQVDMPWSDFLSSMGDLTVGQVGDWCNICGSPNTFCALYGRSGFRGNNGNGRSNDVVRGMRAPVAGIIGAATALGVVFLALAATMLFGGLRFRRSPHGHRSSLGGFKGSEKLASDADLTKHNAVAAEASKGHERVGSWELKDQRKDSVRGDGSAHPGQRIDDDDNISISGHTEPVKVHERV